MIPLILAEKPSQANAYAVAFSNVKCEEGYYFIPPCDVFPDGANLTWGIGHLVTLKEPHEYKEEWKQWSVDTLPMIPEQFLFKVAPDKKKQFNIVKKLIQSASEIIVATDCDREGENIARSIINLAGGSQKPTKRLWINSLEEDEVKKGFQNLKSGKDFLPFYHESQARQISDWIVGINASRLYTLLLQKKGVKTEGVFSVGRVQTPTLKLIYDRQQEIQNFKPEPFFEIEGEFTVSNGKYKGKYKDRFSSKQDLYTYLNEKGIHLSSIQEGQIHEVKKTIKKVQSPKLHSLSTLQTALNKKYKYSPAKVLKIVQKLYDSPLKLVTYPRTDTNYITESEFEYVQKHFQDYQRIAGVSFEPQSLEPNKRYVDSSKVQEHYAIIPTKNIPSESTLNQLSPDERNVYFEILLTTLAMFHKPYIYEETVIQTKVSGVIFETTGKVEVEKGWKELFTKEPEQLNKEEAILPNVEKGEKAKASLSVKEGKTSPPKPYTEGQLINLMKTCGKYLDDVEDQAILKEVEGLGTEATRSGIIETLKAQNYIEIKKNIVHVTKKGEILCKVVNGTLLSKPELTAKWESYLKLIGQKKGSKEVFIKNTIAFTQNLVEATKKHIESSNLDTTIQEIQEEKYIAKCPTCQQGYIVDKKTFYGCTNFKNGCKQTFQKKILDKTISKTQIKKLCEKGKTDKIKGFKGKKQFDAYLKLQDGKTVFEM